MDLELFTERLRLTPLADADIDIVLQIWTDPEVVKYVCDVTPESEIRAEMPDAIKRGGNGGIGEWVIRDRVTDEKLGSIFLMPMPTDRDEVDYDLLVMGQLPDADIEIGYFLKPSAWGQGYATEVCKRVLDLAFREESLNEVVASVDDENAASKHVLEKSGMRDHGRGMSWGKDSAMYRITRDQWNTLQQQTLQD